MDLKVSPIFRHYFTRISIFIAWKRENASPDHAPLRLSSQRSGMQIDLACNAPPQD